MVSSEKLTPSAVLAQVEMSERGWAWDLKLTFISKGLLLWSGGNEGNDWHGFIASHLCFFDEQ